MLRAELDDARARVESLSESERRAALALAGRERELAEARERLGAAEAALAANSLPSWVVQAYLAEKALACASASCGGSEGDASASGLPTPPQQAAPLSAQPVCAC